MMKSIICVFLLSSCFLHVSAQRLGDVKDSAKGQKNGERRDGGSRGGSSNGVFIVMAADIMIRALYEAQVEQLRLAADDDWRISLEADAMAGVDVNNIEFFNSQSLRGNWGLFSSQVRRFDINDVTGRFTTVDWQIVQFNVLNREYFRWLFGVGLSHEVEVNQTHPEFATEFQFSVLDKKLTPSLTYRSSGDGYPRTEFSAMMAYRPFNTNKAELTLKAGYIFQRLYGIPFNFPSVGLGFYLK